MKIQKSDVTLYSAQYFKICEQCESFHLLKNLSAIFSIKLTWCLVHHIIYLMHKLYYAHSLTPYICLPRKVRHLLCGDSAANLQISHWFLLRLISTWPELLFGSPVTGWETLPVHYHNILSIYLSTRLFVNLFCLSIILHIWI